MAVPLSILWNIFPESIAIVSSSEHESNLLVTSVSAPNGSSILILEILYLPNKCDESNGQFILDDIVILLHENVQFKNKTQIIWNRYFLIGDEYLQGYIVNNFL